MTDRRLISEIVVDGRHRKDLGALDDLAASIADVGLLHPIVITPDGRLVAGQRRLEACRMLGWTEIPVTVASGLTDAVDALRAERDENACRKDMTPSEKVALGKALEALERPRAKQRQAIAGQMHGRGKIAAGNLPEAIGARMPVREIVGEAIGMSGSTFERAKAVVEASEDESLPEDVRAAARAAREEMDKTGKVTPAYNAVAPLIGRSAVGGGDEKKGRSRVEPRTKTFKGRSAAKGFRKAYHTLIGLASGLDGIDIADVDPTPEEAEAWERELGGVVTILNRIRRDLRSRK